MKFNQEIFRAYDIRGIYGQDFDDEFAFQLGVVLVSYLNRKKFLVANDSRGFSGKLARELMRGIASAGGDVEYLGLSTTPFFNFAFYELNVDGGAMITASHNGPEYGGFKIFGEDGNPISLNSGLGTIKDLILKNRFESAKYGGRIGELDRRGFLKKYGDFIAKKSGVKPDELKNIKANVNDRGAIMEEVGCVFRDLKLQNYGTDFDIAFTFDGDADRLQVFDKNNNKIRADCIVGLLAEDEIGFWSKPKLVYDSRFSRGVTEKLKERGIKTFRSKAGRTFIREEMVRRRADIAGELSGHIFFKKNHFKESSVLALFRILKILASSVENIDTLIKPFQTWFNSGEINIETTDKNQEMSRIERLVKEKYADGKIDKLDGITIEYPGWWFNIRASNTEPLIRLVVEAKTKELLNEKIAEVKEKMGL